MDIDEGIDSISSREESNDDNEQDSGDQDNGDDIGNEANDESAYDDEENEEEEIILARGDEHGQSIVVAPIIVASEPGSFPEPFTAPPFRVPCMRGILSWKGNKITCRGRWGMSKEAFDGSEATSDFEITLQTEFSLNFDIHSTSQSQLSGIYTGWFCIQQPGKKVAIRIDEKRIALTFVANSSSISFNISGDGQNKFGKFTIQGIFCLEDLSIELYRYYIAKPIRIKQPHQSSAAATAARVAKRQAAMTALAANPNRPKRMNDDVKKCLEILKFLQRQPQTYWFLEPVDAVKLQIPDYHDIVKQPMDFSLIESNMNNHLYQTPEEFASHVRLIFRNAIAYNTKRDSAVNIAARELNSVFEDRYRYVMTSAHLFDSKRPLFDGNSVGSSNDGDELDRQAGSAIKKSSSSSSSSSKKRTSNGSSKNISSGLAKSPKASGPKTVYIMPPIAKHNGPIMDANTSAFLDMQQQVADMRSEIKLLRDKEKKREIRDKTQDKHGTASAKEIMSSEDKSELVDMISRLSGEQQAYVYQTIRKTSGSFFDDIDSGTAEEDGELNFPIDSLDNNTLRDLYQFCKDNLEDEDDDDDDGGGKKRKKRNKRKQASAAVKSPSTQPFPVTNNINNGLYNQSSMYPTQGMSVMNNQFMYGPSATRIGPAMLNSVQLANAAANVSIMKMNAGGSSPAVGLIDMTGLNKRPRLDGPVGLIAGGQGGSTSGMIGVISNAASTGNMILANQGMGVMKSEGMTMAPFPTIAAMQMQRQASFSSPLLSSSSSSSLPTTSVASTGQPVVNPNANAVAANSLMMMLGQQSPVQAQQQAGLPNGQQANQSRFLQF